MVFLPKLSINWVSDGSSGLWSLVRTWAKTAGSSGICPYGLLTAMCCVCMCVCVCVYTILCVVVYMFTFVCVRIVMCVWCVYVRERETEGERKGEEGTRFCVNKLSACVPRTAVESPTFATKILSCRKMTAEAVVPAVLGSPILFGFQVPVIREWELMTCANPTRLSKRLV